MRRRHFVAVIASLAPLVLFAGARPASAQERGRVVIPPPPPETPLPPPPPVYPPPPQGASPPPPGTYPPQGYYPAPLPAPQPYYAPAAPSPRSPGDVISPWDPDDPVPDGYVLRSKASTGPLAAGITLLSVGWVTSIIAGVIAAQDEDARGLDGDGVEAGDWAPMYIPVVGPVIAISSVDASAKGAAFLVADGVLQTAGAALIVLGALKRDYRIVRSAGPIEVIPHVSLERPGLSLQGAF